MSVYDPEPFFLKWVEIQKSNKSHFFQLQHSTNPFIPDVMEFSSAIGTTRASNELPFPEGKWHCQNMKRKTSSKSCLENSPINPPFPRTSRGKSLAVGLDWGFEKNR
ncbi:hypothetical protein CEXT_518451 [Caerostris extrusa]|uniref:Uncharacterized protein n=1 Tax=Caerostris extrusa TaxID=172846 RepID=A0AAV4TYV7_CAEEX|nr:hypothetical protein CEXT_518451 [Caerostris extrusa]